jgi:hypothetical protein
MGTLFFKKRSPSSETLEVDGDVGLRRGTTGLGATFNVGGTPKGREGAADGVV